MLGLIFTELQKYVNHKFDYSTWKLLLEKSDLTGKVYIPTQIYPDAEILGIVAAASEVTNMPGGTILEDFGKFLVPDLLRVFSASVNPEWKTLDMLENIEGTIHRAVRQREPGATPPKLICKRTSPTSVEIIYSSPRKICFLAIGLIKGIIEHYQEHDLKISEPECMHKGATACVLVIER